MADPGPVTRPTLLLVNGASGVGKTTTASWLQRLLRGSIWVHPDGLWDTPRMTSEDILTAALERLSREAAAVSMIDCQIRGSDARRLLRSRPELRLVNVLLTCSRDERERRLRARSSEPHDLERIETWSQVLLGDARDCGDPIVDTTFRTTGSVAERILEIGIGPAARGDTP